MHNNLYRLFSEFYNNLKDFIRNSSESFGIYLLNKIYNNNE
jgi:hypothetical protein